MADQNLNDFLSGPVMTTLAQSEEIKGGLPRYLPPSLWKPSSARPENTEVKYLSFQGNRKAAKVVHHNSPSRQRQLTGAKWNMVTALGSREHFVIETDQLGAMKSDLEYKRLGAMGKYKRDMANFRSVFEDFRTGLVCSAVLTGKIAYDANGSLVLPTNGAAINTIDFGAKTVALSGALPGSSVTVPDFGTVGTDIPSFIRSLQQAFTFYNGYQINTIAYGKNIPSRFANNTAMQVFMSRSQKTNDEFYASNEVPKGTLNIPNWSPAYMNYFIDETNSDTPTSWIGDDQIAVMADPADDTFYEFVEAGSMIPLNQVTGDIDQMVKDLTVTWGIHAYAQPLMDPIKVKVVMGDYTLPVVKNGKCLWIITVH